MENLTLFLDPSLEMDNSTDDVDTVKLSYKSTDSQDLEIILYVCSIFFYYLLFLAYYHCFLKDVEGDEKKKRNVMNTCTMKEARQLYAKIKQKAEHVMDKKHEEDACWDPEIGMTDFKMIGI